ncbi:NAD(P)-dependent alcohol dehydrogenase [Rhodococcus fascians]|uniref:NAD(P)-dependent alcohol dehydrogenase n=1 Tax=Rhodococcoides fascians TaxID=1828 RepID=UPI001961E22B|nr:NAD(P)-dependent alcohol dehydrogenase [Rhodococcus fascians]MBM7244428.1 NAD(P)-dependent alcohol dehydrogenase [Rhodococcus fascians]MBY3808046.1 NAD(P)-dependent alcohol dehydrogenase [Rhodococcus fascians]MBY3839594.1 NAD(P)-dependent alcohol dehydrogenase [Rhodococcus fascians]MBY3847857.1 NAD(P)-dependent alcohol dehydrogenase [Rhodococcus fascians]MBY3851351.1 NAD(P)-dependent alcohol dehydrogenase [Rhodococcus fascians]
MSYQAKAAVVATIGSQFVIEPVTVEEPRADEVLVKIVAAGMCGTDLGVAGGHIPFRLPGVLGHEGAGIVERVGDNVTSVARGDKVLLSFTSCGVCRNCRFAHPAYCDEFLPRNLLGGRRPDGSTPIRSQTGELNAHFFAQSSFSTLAIADERGVTKVDDDADLALLAPLGCGIQTGAGAVLNILKPTPGTSIVVFGAGAVGMAAIMAAALSGATMIVAVDVVKSRLELAMSVGGTHIVDPADEDTAQRISTLTDGRGVDYAIDATGNSEVLATAIRSLAPLGTVAVIGAPSAGTTVDVDVNFILNGRTIVAVTEGDSVPQEFLPALAKLVAEGRFPLERLIRRYPFENINEAARGIRDGSVLKPVLMFGDSNLPG